MKYTPSINIAQTIFDPNSYIVTQNAIKVIGNIVNSFNAGVHSFNIIGSYGTGKSNFILALEDSLKNNSKILITNKGQFNGFVRFRFEKIVGDYTSLQRVLTENLFPTEASDNLFENLKSYFKRAEKREEFVILVIDEFGKLLEYAAKNNPERELYLFQKFTEFINDERRNAILLTTLHQNFNSYSRTLTESQRNEWTKVKGRFQEIVFNEPIEQLLYLASKRIERTKRDVVNQHFKQIYNLAIASKFASSSIAYDTAVSLYPLDIFAAQALTQSIQRYGQNERTLFSFLEATGQGSLHHFKEKENTTYSLADVYDYDIYNFYSYLSEVNADSTAWTAIRVSLERVESLFEGETATDAMKLIKTIGMFNLFGKAGVQFNKEKLSEYAKFALGIDDPVSVIELLTQHKIIRYATYKSQYILFEGTDVNIEGELLKAAGIVPRSKDIVEKLITNFNFPIEFANASYYREKAVAALPTVSTLKCEKNEPYKYVSGKLRPDGKPGFNTPTGKLELFSTITSKYGLEGLPVYKEMMKPEGDFNLRLINGTRKPYITHSKTRSDAPYLLELEPVSTIHMNPADAKKRGLVTGDFVEMRSKFGGPVRARIDVSIIVPEGTIDSQYGWRGDQNTQNLIPRQWDPISGYAPYFEVNVSVAKVK